MLYIVTAVGDVPYGEPKGQKGVLSAQLETLRQKDYREISLWRDLGLRSPKG